MTDQTAAIEVLARLLCAADVHVHGNATWQQMSTTLGRSVQDGYRDAARWLLPRMTVATKPAVVPVPLSTQADRRAQLLDALDFAYCQGLGFDTPEALLVAYDASRAVPVPPPADQTAFRQRIAEAIWERQNPGRRWADCEYRWRADAEADADAVLAVLPEPTDRAAVLLEAADFVRGLLLTRTSITTAGLEAELRRMAAEAQQQATPGPYRHFKGGTYDVVANARHTESDEQLVVYRSGAAWWCRPVSSFTSEVTVDGKTRLRFEPANEAQPEAPAPETQAAPSWTSGPVALARAAEWASRQQAATVDPAVCPRCKGDNTEAFALCAACAPDRLRCPRCREDLTDYDEDDFVYRTGDDRPYCSGECVIATHRAAEEQPTETPMFGTPDCTCIPFTRQGGKPRYCGPTDTVDMISGWEIGRDCPHHKTAVGEQPETQHVGGRANAEDCPACSGTNPPYPFLCPGPDAPLLRSEDACPGFPERCPNLRTVDPNPPKHLGGIRCGCADPATP